MIPTTSTRIRDFYGRMLGTLEEDKDGNQQVRNFSGQILATYDKKLDVTRDFYGRILTKGNTCTGYLFDKSRNT